MKQVRLHATNEKVFNNKRKSLQIRTFFLLLMLSFSMTAVAQVCNCTWSYRVPITITNLGASSLTNYQVSVTVNTAALVAAGKMQASGNDIRFNDASCTNLPYWIESGMNTGSTVIWINVNNIAPSTTTTIYMQYGNASAAAASDGNATFLLFDDFNGSSLDASKWTLHNSGGSLTISGGTASFNSTNEVDIVSNSAFASPYTSEMKVNSASGNWPNIGQVDNGNPNSGNVMGIGGGTMFSGHSSAGCAFYDFFFDASTTAGSVVGTWSFTRTATNNFGTWPGGSISNTYNFPTTAQQSAIGSICSGSGSIVVDWFRARKYYAAGTTQSIGAESRNCVVFNNGTPQSLRVCQNSGSNSINSLLTATEGIGGTDTWTIQSGPTHGTLSGFPTSAASGTSITPSGLSYTPTPGYSGTDAFTIQVSDGAISASTTINVTIDPTPSALPTGGAPVTTTFAYTGAAQTFTVPAGVSLINVKLWGAQGGQSEICGGTFDNDGGLGGYADGSLTVTTGQVLNIYVGGKPATIVTIGSPVGGFNGGGIAGQYGGGGGGASDIRVGGTALANRVIVAGGGGGGNTGCPDHGTGGVGGGLTGGNGINLSGGYIVGGGGTQFAGGTPGSPGTAGSYGQGGDGSGYHQAGGGGGYYGGGSAYAAGAGGGSSYIGGVAGGSTTSGIQAGNGMVTLTYASAVGICVGGTTTLTNTAAGGTWSSSNPSAATINPATGLLTAIAPGSTVISYTMPCGSSVSTTYAVFAKPTASPTNDGPICVGGTATLTPNPTGGVGAYSYSWTDPTSFSSSAATPTVTPGVTTTYSLIVSNAAPGCVSATYNTTVSVNAKPSASPTNDGPICVTGTANLTANPTGGVGAYIYSWSGSNLSSSTIANPSATPTTTATYSLVVSNAASGCASGIPYTTTVTVNPKPTVAPSNDGSICVGGTVNLAANPAGGVGAYIYNWSGTDLSSSTIANPSATPATTATYSLTVSNAASGCSSGIVYTTTATVNAKPTAAPTNDGPICVGGTVNLTANAANGVGPYIYNWTGASLSSSTVANPSATPTITGTYSLTVSNAASGCSSGIAYTTLATVNAKPTASPSNDGPICIDGTVNLAANPAGGVGAYIYSWSGTNLSSSTIANPSATPTATATYSVTVSNAASGCSSGIIYTTMATVNAKPTAAPVNDGAICVGGTLNLTANAADGVGAYIYNWSGADLSSSTVANPTAMPTGTSTYSLTVSNAASGCSSGIVYTTTATVNPKPSATPTNDGPICVGGTVNFVANPAGGVGAYMYNWSGPALSSSTIDNPSATPTSTYGYSLVVTNAASGCTSPTYISTATVNAKPTVAPSNDGPICIDGTVNLMANPAGGVGAYIYSWSGANLSSSTIANPTATPTVTSTYSLVVSNAASGCSSGIIYNTTATVNAKPVAAPTNDGPICLGGTVNLEAHASGGVGAYIYSWSGSALSATNVANPTAAPGGSNTYSVTVSNAASGCNSGIAYTTSVHVDTLYTPIVTISGNTSIKAGQTDTLKALSIQGGPGVTYQWVLNGSYIAGATNSTYISSSFKDGDIVTCYVTSHSPCGSVSSSNYAVITINNVGVKTVSSSTANITLVPNPNKGSFVLDGNLGFTSDKEIIITVVNMLGQTIYNGTETLHNGELHKGIQLSNIASGTYILNVHTDDDNRAFHFVVE